MDDYCKNCGFYNPKTKLKCDFGRDNLVVCSVLMKKIKDEKRKVKYG